MGNLKKPTPENYIKDIRCKTRRLFTTEQKVLIVMEALRVQISVAELCRKHQINESQFYKWIGAPKRQGVFGSWQETVADRWKVI